jgi:hypothetical protein
MKDQSMNLSELSISGLIDDVPFIAEKRQALSAR